MSGAEPFLADGSQELFPCEVCGRRFAADVLKRHGPICRKLFHKKRKLFNSLKQRLQGMDIPTVRKAPPSKSQPVRKSNWRQQHEDFINAIQSVKQCTLAVREGRPLPPAPTPSVNPDYIQCPYCMRRFNETAAGRHINFCKDQSSRRVFDPAQTAAKLASRAQGRAQASPRKEPTVTRAVGALLQSRPMEAKTEVSTKSSWLSETLKPGNPTQECHLRERRKGSVCLFRSPLRSSVFLLIYSFLKKSY
ncbi:zinc finger C2HC domain-containing protein 1B isoform X1 [Heterocephalus glaber]|uniref:Zinc finger C2HC domain-containing protein 1B isoform X1 n=1 Tax=Heterocephalus glaber TaxID=10181 RepID=A0AAX6T4T1_HETGA|nr:zinc finger C2HC domain-containing protein 1B isoform X1 [Heterocephalus glaber]